MKGKLLKCLREEAKGKYKIKKNIIYGVEHYFVVQIDFIGEYSSEKVLFDSNRYEVVVPVLEKYRTQYIKRKIEIMKYGTTGIFLDV